MTMQNCQSDQHVIADESYFVTMYFAGASTPQRVTDGDLDTPELACQFAEDYMREHELAEFANINCFVQYADGTSEIHQEPIYQISRADLPEVMAPC